MSKLSAEELEKIARDSFYDPIRTYEEMIDDSLTEKGNSEMEHLTLLLSIPGTSTVLELPFDRALIEVLLNARVLKSEYSYSNEDRYTIQKVQPKLQVSTISDVERQIVQNEIK